MRCILSGGAFLEPDLARKWENLGIPVVEGYGATECSPVIASNTFSHRRPGTVGRSLPGVEVKLSGEGEVLVRGDEIYGDGLRRSATFVGSSHGIGTHRLIAPPVRHSDGRCGGLFSPDGG